MERLIEFALKLALPIFRKSQKLQKVAIRFIEEHTDAVPDPSKSKNRPTEYEYVLSRYRNYLQSKFFSEELFAEPKSLDIEKRVCVVTALFGDEAQELAQYEFIDGVDYLYVSDRELDISPKWQRFRVEIPLEFSKSPRHSARWVKTSLPSLFADYDLAVWIDANIVVIEDLNPLIQKAFEEQAQIMVYSHSQWTNLDREAEAVIALGKDKRNVVEKQMKFYRQKGVTDLPLWETPVIFVKVSDKTKAAFSLWQQTISDFSIRDQLSFPYAMNQTGIDVTPISESGANIRSNPYFLSIPHQRSSFPGRKFKFHHLLEPNVDIEQDSVRMPFSVVVPVHGAITQVKYLVHSLEHEELGTVAGDECIIVDDFSDKTTADELEALANRHPWITVLRNSDNIGFSYSVNKGAQNSKNDYMVIANSDIILPGNLLSNFSNSLTSNRISVLGSLSNRAGHQSLIDRRWASSWSHMGDIGIPSTANLLEKVYGRGKTILFPQIHGSLFCVNREVFNSLGGFDAEAFPIGYGEEVDFCLRASEAGHLLGLCLSTAYHHFGSASFGNDERRSSLKEKSRETLTMRHGQRLFDIEEIMKNSAEIEGLRFLFSIARKS